MEGDTLSLLRLTSNSPPTTNFLWLSPTDNCLNWTMLNLISSGHRPRTENIASVLLCDITAYAEVCLLSRCPEMGCITLLFYCCVYYLATAISVAHQFLHGANTPHYCPPIYAWVFATSLPFRILQEHFECSFLPYVVYALPLPFLIWSL
jgi:hypothetical protein